MPIASTATKQAIILAPAIQTIIAAITKQAILTAIAEQTIVIRPAKQCGAILTAEEHQVNGGLGTAVAQVITKNCPVPMDMVGLEDTFGQSGTAGELLEFYGLDAKSIAKRAKSLHQRKA